MASRQQGGRFTRGLKRPTSWEGTIFNLQLVTATSAFATITTEAILENTLNSTLIRQRGNVLVYDQVRAAQTIDSVVGLGIYLANNVAVGVGITALQLPITDIGSDWLWHTLIPIASNYDAAGDQALDAPLIAMREVIDGKAMRKVDPNQVLVLVGQVQDFGGAANVRVVGGVRLLYKR